MGSVDARVNHIRAGAGAGAVIVDVRGRARGLVGDTTKTPGGTGLRDVGVDGVDGVLLDVLDLFSPQSETDSSQHHLVCEFNTHLGQVTELVENRVGDLASKALELDALVDMVGLGDLAEGLGEGLVGDALPQLHNVLPRKSRASAGLDDGGTLVQGPRGGRGRKSSGQERQEGGGGEVHLDEIGPVRGSCVERVLLRMVVPRVCLVIGKEP